jgi:hypothetical protein
MYRCIELAGFAAAQVVCCLFDRIPFVPLAFSRRAPDRKSVSILSGGTPEVIAARGQAWLDANRENADEAVVAIDGYVTLPPGPRRDAIILDLRAYREHNRQMRIAVPYRPHHDPAGFAVYRPKMIVAAVEGADVCAMQAAFVQGVCSHEYGARIWHACSDERG